MAFDVQRAKQAGYSQQEIDSYLAKSQTSKPMKTVEETRRGNKLPETIGGIGGGILGGITFGLPGAVVGSSLLGGAGNLLNDTAAEVAAMRQRQKGTPENIGELGGTFHGGGFGETVKSGIRQGGYELLGGLIGKLLKFGAHPIKSVVDTMVVNPLKKSPKMVNINKILGDLYKKGGDMFSDRLMSSEFPEAYGKLQSNVISSASNKTPHLPAENIAPGIPQSIGDIADLNVPIADANLLKSNAQRGVAEFYGEKGPAVIELQKLLATLLKKEIESNAPKSVATGNKIASLMYGLPDILTGLTYGLPWSAGRSVRAGVGAPIKLLQYLLDNPATQRGLPAFSHLLGGGEE